MKPKIVLTFPTLACLGAFLMVLGTYYYHFGQRPVSDDPGAWGGFGDYVGGSLSPLLTIANIAVVVYISFQIHQMETKREQEARLHEQSAEKDRRAAEKRQLAFTLYEHLMLAPEFRTVWGTVAVLRKQWCAGDRRILNHFLIGDDLERPEEEMCANGASPHQNLSIALHSWAAVQVYREQGFLDDGLVISLLGHTYRWNEDFFREFVENYNNQPEIRRRTPQPMWTDAIPKLQELLSPNQSLHPTPAEAQVPVSSSLTNAAGTGEPGR